MDLNRALVEDAVRTLGKVVVGDSDSLAHYASPYYDPVKAKEYYERTKKLKGTKPMTKTQNEVYRVSKSNITKAKSKESEKAATDTKARIEAIQAKAVATVKSIEDKMAKLSTELEAKITKVIEENKAVPLNSIPANATPKQREYLERQNNQIRNANAKKANKSIKAQAQAVESARKDAQAQRKAIGESMKAEVQKARTDYKAQMDSIKVKYETADKKEQANIRTQVK